MNRTASTGPATRSSIARRDGLREPSDGCDVLSPPGRTRACAPAGALGWSCTKRTFNRCQMAPSSSWLFRFEPVTDATVEADVITRRTCRSVTPTSAAMSAGRASGRSASILVTTSAVGPERRRRRLLCDASADGPAPSVCGPNVVTGSDANWAGTSSDSSMAIGSEWSVRSPGSPSSGDGVFVEASAGLARESISTTRSIATAGQAATIRAPMVGWAAAMFAATLAATPAAKSDPR